MKPSRVSIGGGGFPLSHTDARDDLGYGRLHPKYHVEKMLGNDAYPYRDEDEDLEDVDLGLDDDTIEAILGLIDQPHDYDPGGGHYDPFSYAGSNTSLAGPAHIGESGQISGLVPFPDMYKSRGRQPGSRGTGTARPGGSTMAATIDTGDRWGWANPPLDDLVDEKSEEEHNYTLEDIAAKDDPLRECIRMLILELT